MRHDREDGNADTPTDPMGGGPEAAPPEPAPGSAEDSDPRLTRFVKWYLGERTEFVAEVRVLRTADHDPITGVRCLCDTDLGRVPESPTQEDARAAAQRLLSGVSQFKWVSEADKSVWLALVLTVAARHAIPGDVPLFAFVATGPGNSGSGKTVLVKAAALIGTGCKLPSTPYPTCRAGAGRVENDEELRKLGTTVVMAGHPIMLLDNVPTGHPFGSPVLDSIITSEVDAGRELRTMSGPCREMHTVWCVTGNNIRPANDTVRRTLPAALHSEEKNLSGQDYEGPELTEWTRANRAELFAACLTIVSASIRAGRPDMGLPPWGGFNGWSDLIRSAVVWAGFPDPFLTRHRLVTTDEDRQRASALMDVLDDLSPTGRPLTVAEILTTVTPEMKQGPTDEYQDPAAVFALRTLFPKPPLPDTGKLGRLFRKYHGTEVRGRRIVGQPDRNKVMHWSVGGQPSVPPCGGCHRRHPPRSPATPRTHPWATLAPATRTASSRWWPDP
jgi:hypothetical protein